MVLYLAVAAVPMVVAVTALRRRQPGLPRPFRMWLYPLPGVIAMAGWMFVISTSGWQYLAIGACVIAAGIAAYLWRARRAAEWPFQKELS
jgi:amino acid transporter